MDAYTIARLKAWLPADPTARLMDLGCGDGALIHALQREGHILAHGIDLRWTGERGVCWREDCRAWLARATSDYAAIVAWDVLEHLPVADLSWTVERIAQALASGGRLIAHVPNAEGLFGSRIFFSDPTHQWAWTPQLAREMLGKAAFRRIQILEDRPVIHGPVSAGRWLAWAACSAVGRLALAAETGQTDGIMSQTMTIVADV